MHPAKPILLIAIAAAIALYAFDCGAATTPEKAMQCCDSMPCVSHGHHGQDCCKTMPSMHAPFVRPSSVNSVSCSIHVFAVLPTFGDPDESLGVSDRPVAANGHAPPILCVTAPLPL